MKKVLLSIIGGQNLPNYLASIMVSPDVNILFYSAASKANMLLLKETLSAEVLAYEIQAFNYNAMFSLADRIFKQYAGHELYANITGGTKIESIALFDAARANNSTSIYMNTEDNSFIRFTASGGITTSLNEEIRVKGDIKKFIRLRGEETIIRLEPETPARLQLRTFLENNFYNFSDIILSFASRNTNDVSQPIEKTSGRYLGTCIRYAGRKSTIMFYDKQQHCFGVEEEGSGLAEYIRGAWFEHACYQKLLDTGHFDDLLLNVTIRKKQTAPSDKFEDKNEIDIIGIKGIFPSIFECKSGKIKPGAIEKLIAIKQNYLPRYTQMYLITYFALSEKVEQHRLLKERMRDAGIVHLLYHDLSNIGHKVIRRANL